MLVSLFDKSPQTVENLGGKGYGLWWMQGQGINVPPALIIPTTVCLDYMKNPVETMKAVAAKLPEVRKFFVGQMGYMPLLSVRSGARVSMPGMMDTLLNVGLDPSTIGDWDTRLGAYCATDNYLRLIKMYAAVVKGAELGGDVMVGPLQRYEEQFGEAFPDADAQLLNSIEAVFKSWNNERAKFYRQMHKYSDDWGTAVVVQAMVFGNLNDNSGSGVMFSRNPDTGENEVVGEFLINAQGEEVVAGTKTPRPMVEVKDWDPDLYTQLVEVAVKLEKLKNEVQDIEWTVQDGVLYILQTRTAKRSGKAAVKIAMDMYAAGQLKTTKDLFAKVTVQQFEKATQRMLDPKFKDEPAHVGLPASAGVATGQVVLSAQAAIDCKGPCILVTRETTPDDVAGMNAAAGVLTMTGGVTSHAAVVARSMNKPCVVGLTKNIELFKAGDILSIDGETGRVWSGPVPVVDGSSDPTIQGFEELMFKALSKTKVTDTPEAATDLCLDLSFDLSTDSVLAKITKAKKLVTGTVYVDLGYEGHRPLDKVLLGMFEDDEGAQKRQKAVEKVAKGRVKIAKTSDQFSSKGQALAQLLG